jgi:hypothetical protein
VISGVAFVSTLIVSEFISTSFSLT